MTKLNTCDIIPPTPQQPIKKQNVQKTKRTIEVGPMIWMLSINEVKIQEEKTHVKQCNAWKWFNTKIGPTSMTPWCGHVPTKEWLIYDSSKKEWWLKKKKTYWTYMDWIKKKLRQLISYFAKFLKNGSLRDDVENICDI